MLYDLILMLPPGSGFDSSNALPSLTVPGAQSAVSNVQLNITGTSISDAELSQTQTITLTVSHGTITIPNTTGLTWTVGDGVADATMTFYGSQFNCNVGLSAILYTSTTDYVGADSLAISTNDGAGGVDSDSVAITVTWTPLSLGAELYLWFDPSYGTYSDAGSTAAVADDPVYRWVPRAGSASGSIYFEQATLANRPLLKQAAGGDYFLLGDGTNDQMSPNALISPADATMCIQLYKVNASNDNGGWGRFGSGGNTHSNLADGNTYDAFGTDTRPSFTGPTWQDNWIRYTITAKAGEWTARSNGTQLYTRASNTVAWQAVAAGQVLFASEPGANYWGGRGGHVVIATALTSGQISLLEAWALTEIPA